MPKPAGKLPQLIDELSVEVSDATFNLALILRIRRMSKLCINPVSTAPVLPLLLKLLPMITQNSLRKPPNFLQYSHCFSRRQFTVKLLSRNDESAVVVDAHQKPVLLALNAEGPFEINLPQLVRLFGPEELPALALFLIAVLVVSCKDSVYGFS